MKNSSEGFFCINCKKFVTYSAPGTKNRNHCPFCLYSYHIDIKPGDRKNTCKGKMPAIGKTYKKDQEEVLIHKCEKCGFERKNRVAGDDNYKAVDKLPIFV